MMIARIKLRAQITHIITQKDSTGSYSYLNLPSSFFVILTLVLYRILLSNGLYEGLRIKKAIRQLNISIPNIKGIAKKITNHILILASIHPIKERGKTKPTNLYAFIQTITKIISKSHTLAKFKALAINYRPSSPTIIFYRLSKTCSTTSLPCFHTFAFHSSVFG